MNFLLNIQKISNADIILPSSRTRSGYRSNPNDKIITWTLMQTLIVTFGFTRTSKLVMNLNMTDCHN